MKSSVTSTRTLNYFNMPFKKTDKGEFWHEKGRIWTASSRVIAEKKAQEVGGKITDYPYKVIKNDYKLPVL